jgi:hypothetical protein
MKWYTTSLFLPFLISSLCFAVFFMTKPPLVIYVQPPRIKTPKACKNPEYDVPLSYTRRLMSGGHQNYTTIGFLTHEHDILPLYGKVSRTNHDRWNYYTITNRLSSIRIPIFVDNSDCTVDMGCKELYNGDLVRVHDTDYVAHLYDRRSTELFQHPCSSNGW